MKAGWAYEEQGQYEKALEIYKRIKLNSQGRRKEGKHRSI